MFRTPVCRSVERHLGGQKIGSGSRKSPVGCKVVRNCIGNPRKQEAEMDFEVKNEFAAKNRQARLVRKV